MFFYPELVELGAQRNGPLAPDMKAPFRSHRLVLACVTCGTITLFCGGWPALGQDESKPLPEGSSLAARYPGDEGLERNARVLDDFEITE
jgi:hypothetical protein